MSTKLKDLIFIALMGLCYGALSTLAFAPFNYPLLAWVALCPLFVGAVKYRDNIRALVLFGLTSTAFLSLTAFHWIIPSAGKLVGENGWISGGIFLLFALTSSVREISLVLLIGFLAREAWQKYLSLSWLSVACVGVLVDGLVPKVIPVSWGNLITGNVYLVQVVEYTGVLGLAFLLFSVNFFIYQYAATICRSYRLKHPLVLSSNTFDSLALVILFGSLVFGVTRLSDVRAQQAELPTVRIAAIQPDSLLVENSSLATARDAVYKLVGDTIPRLIRASSKAAGYRLDMIVLPEAAVPYSSTNANELTRKWRLYAPPLVDMITAMAGEQGVSIFFNEPAIVQGTGKPWQSNGVAVNSTVLFSPDGHRGDSYEKNILFPVGEIIPFAGILEALHLLERVPQDVLARQYLPGTKQNVISYGLPKNPLAHSRFLPLVCYEGVFAGHARSFFSSGDFNPEYIVNLTQDGWFTNTIAIHQHFELVRIRAVETRRALIRAANTGISALIGLDGQVVLPISGPAIAKGHPEGFQVWDVPVQQTEATFYVRHGDGSMLLLTVSLLMLSAAIRTFRASRKRHGKLMPS
ncbi:apolipoprotein N-acyltransferase [Pyxidicoccus caerfyrddinensis]|uniref:apolipoprotein N-acyltransferase n=1 Tax=Pyxidicoccus caerfyrddinensis TaxID=2709663 RepID=UPI0013DA0970|nr:apolipoprotein N-acyltransferase [Pyxidicoccus caerfyrddinensis]